MAEKKKTVHEKVIREVIERPAKKKTAKKKKRKTTKRKTSTTTTRRSPSDLRVEKALIDNFVSLQKVMVNFSAKFEDLSNQISKLLNIFEISAKTLAEKEFVAEQDKKDNKEIMNRMSDIIDQNKTIARGITLMHDLVTGEEEKIDAITPRPMMSSNMSSPSIPKPQMKPPKMPAPQMNPQMPSQGMPMPKPSQKPSDLYQKSIYSKEDDKNNSQ